MGEQGRGGMKRQKAALLRSLRKLANWRNNDAMKLILLDGEKLEQIDRLDLSGVAELKRGANGAFEVKFVDRLRVLAMLRELLEGEEGQSGELAELLRDMGKTEDGDEA